MIGRARVVLPAMLVVCSLALLIGNYGTIVRQRLQVTVFLVPSPHWGGPGVML